MPPVAIVKTFRFGAEARRLVEKTLCAGAAVINEFGFCASTRPVVGKALVSAVAMIHLTGRVRGRGLAREMTAMTLHRGGRIRSKGDGHLSSRAGRTHPLSVACPRNRRPLGNERALSRRFFSLEAGTNIGQTPIDKIVFKEGYNPGTPPNESSPLSTGIRAYLVERAKQGGAAAVEAALTEADASCSPPVRHSHHCEIRRYRILRSIDLLPVFAKYGRTDWIISISYERRGNAIQNVHVTYTESYKLLE